MLSFAKIMQSTEYSEIWLNLTVAALSLIFIRGHKAFPVLINYLSGYPAITVNFPEVGKYNVIG